MAWLPSAPTAIEPKRHYLDVESRPAEETSDKLSSINSGFQPRNILPGHREAAHELVLSRGLALL